MRVNLILDGNYLLSKLVFTLHKHNLLFGALESSLVKTVDNYRGWYPFENVFLVSDSKEKSWRKKLKKTYKANRKKNTDIDWGFVYETYDQYKSKVPIKIKVLEKPTIEGDDWISFLCEESNRQGVSTIIVSNDYDIKQLVKFSLNPLVINVMTNEMFNKEKLFLPNSYSIFLNAVNALPNNDIFNLNNNVEFISMMKKFINKYDVKEINHIESLVIKLISGDRSDNIESVWVQNSKNGKPRGIGEKGAQTLYDEYIKEFGDINIDDVDLFENIADLICEKKKISKVNIDEIINNLKSNSDMIDLRTKNIPNDIMDIIREKYESFYKKVI